MKKLLFLSLVSTILVVSLLLKSQVADAGWSMTFSDEFNGQTQVNTSAWNLFYSFSPAIINQELEFYSPDAFEFTPSTLRIVAERRPGFTSQLNYTSGVITTKYKWAQTYGYFEVSAKLPAGNGYWPAFWMLPVSASLPLEIDIFEILEQSPQIAYYTYHCDYSSGNINNKGGSSNVSALINGGFHTYGLQWIPGTLIWYVDGVQRFNLSNSCIPNTPEYILLNLAVGGSWPVPPDASTPFPNYMEIDYVRAYKYVSSGGVTLPGQVGSGVPYTAPTPDAPNEACVIGPILPNTTQVVAGQTINFSVSINCKGGITGANAGVNLYPYTLAQSGSTSVASAYTSNLNCGSGVACNFNLLATVPSGTANGYYRVSFGVWVQNWSSGVTYGSAVAMIGVGPNYPIGRKGYSGSASPTSGPSISRSPL